MKTSFKILFLLFLFSFVAIAQIKNKSIADIEKKSFAKKLKIDLAKYPGDQSINITYYKLNLTITYNPNHLNGTVTVEGKSTIQNLNSFFLDLQEQLKVDSVLMNGNRLNFNHENEQIKINLPAAINSNEKFSVNIYYQGIPGSSGFGSFEFGQHNSLPAIYTLSEPYGASDWWPCKDTPADKADSSDVIVTCNKNFKAVSNGSLTQTIINKNNTATYFWKNHHPIAQYLISLAIADYREFNQEFKYGNFSMPVTHYVYPEYYDVYKSNLAKTIDMLKIFSDKFGVYPFIDEKYGHAQFGWSGGMEHQTISSMGTFGEDIQSHELAHQWFGDKITCRNWHHIWLNEGFATYLQAIYYEFKYSKYDYDSFIRAEMIKAAAAEGSIYVKDISSISEIFNSNRTYAKGAVVLHMLRGVLGDSLFFKTMRAYANDPALAYGTAVTEDFQKVAEGVSGLDLNYFFTEWINGVNYPNYSYSWTKEKKSGNIYEVILQLNQTINLDPTFFTMPVEFKINTSDGDTTIVFFNNKIEQQFTFDVKGNPTYITLDPDNKILKSVKVSDPVDLTKPEEFELKQNYPNPFNPTTTIEYSIPRSVSGFVPVKIKLFDLLGNELTTLVDEEKPAGKYQLNFNGVVNGKRLSSGVYFYSISSKDYFNIKKMMLIK